MGSGAQSYMRKGVMAGYLILIRDDVCVVSAEEAGHNALIKKKIKFSSYIRKFGWDRVQSRICGRGSQYMRKMHKYFYHIRGGH